MRLDITILQTAILTMDGFQIFSLTVPFVWPFRSFKVDSAPFVFRYVRSGPEPLRPFFTEKDRKERIGPVTNRLLTG